jgi:hypothetical protein
MDEILKKLQINNKKDLDVNYPRYTINDFINSHCLITLIEESNKIDFDVYFSGNSIIILNTKNKI